MERQLWKSIVEILKALDKPHGSVRLKYSDEWIVAVWYWSVIHDRPLSWAVIKGHWPLDLRKRQLPSNSRMSVRLRSPSVRALLQAVERRVVAPPEPGMYWIVDGKSMPIGGCSKDRQAGYGRAAGGHARGYKLHAIVGGNGSIGAWRIAPMNVDERVMARRMIRNTPLQGYLLGDGNYDSNPLHDACGEDLQLVTPRRSGGRRGLGRHRHSPHRLRSVTLTEDPLCQFGRDLLKHRFQIEQTFGHLTNWGGGLNGLPAWVRTHRRVHRWVQDKLVITALKRRLAIRTYAA